MSPLNVVPKEWLQKNDGIFTSHAQGNYFHICIFLFLNFIYTFRITYSLIQISYSSIIMMMCVRERERDWIKKNHYMQWGQFWDLSFLTFTLFLLSSYNVSYWWNQFWLGLTPSITYISSSVFTLKCDFMTYTYEHRL